MEVMQHSFQLRWSRSATTSSSVVMTKGEMYFLSVERLGSTRVSVLTASFRSFLRVEKLGKNRGKCDWLGFVWFPRKCEKIGEDLKQNSTEKTKN